MDIQKKNDEAGFIPQISIADNITTLGREYAMAAQVSKSPVKEAINQLENAIDIVFELVTGLENRLEFTLAPILPTAEKENNTAKTPTGNSPLFGHLTNCNERLLQLQERLQEMYHRVEL